MANFGTAEQKKLELVLKDAADYIHLTGELNHAILTLERAFSDYQLDRDHIEDRGGVKNVAEDTLGRVHTASKRAFEIRQKYSWVDFKMVLGVDFNKSEREFNELYVRVQDFLKS